jgi:hypothetical protein
MLMVDIESLLKRKTCSKHRSEYKMRYAIALITNVNSLDEVSLDFQKS